MVGAEFEYRHRLPWSVGRGALELGLTLDWVPGLNRSGSTNLPRMTPIRETVALGYRSSAFSAELEAQRSEAQGIVAPYELPTNAFTQGQSQPQSPRHFKEPYFLMSGSMLLMPKRFAMKSKVSPVIFEEVCPPEARESR
jgi:hypothetical protein